MRCGLPFRQIQCTFGYRRVGVEPFGHVYMSLVYFWQYAKLSTFVSSKSEQLNSGSVDRIPLIRVGLYSADRYVYARTSDNSIIVVIEHRFEPMVQFVVICVIFSSDQLSRTTSDPLYRVRKVSAQSSFHPPVPILSALACLYPLVVQLLINAAGLHYGQSDLRFLMT